MVKQNVCSYKLSFFHKNITLSQSTRFVLSKVSPSLEMVSIFAIFVRCLRNPRTLFFHFRRSKISMTTWEFQWKLCLELETTKKGPKVKIANVPNHQHFRNCKTFNTFSPDNRVDLPRVTAPVRPILIPEKKQYWFRKKMQYWFPQYWFRNNYSISWFIVDWMIPVLIYRLSTYPDLKSKT